jgi:predicted ATP-grasp superfamily ATP-dependent carboligase
MAACDRLRGRWPAGVTVAIPDAAALATANDKAATARFAESLGIRTPRTRLVSTPDEALMAAADIGLPMVLKSAREEGRKVLRYVRDHATMAQSFNTLLAQSSGPLLAQELIAGEGYGFCALYWRGALQRRFMHRRVREWPPNGGTSACAESVPEAPELERAGRALLDALHWHGVAMVEFKGGLTPGALALIEINAKFWGSLDVALAAGVDFPGDLATLMDGGTLAPQPPVRRVRFAWPLGGDLWHGVFRPAALPAVAWDAVSPMVAHNFRLSDPVPSLFEFVQWVRSTPGAFREAQALR